MQTLDSVKKIPVMSQLPEYKIGAIDYFDGKATERIGSHHEITESVCTRINRYTPCAFDGMIGVKDRNGVPYIWMFENHRGRELFGGEQLGFYKPDKTQLYSNPKFHDFIMKCWEAQGGYDSGMNYCSIAILETGGGQGVSPVQETGIRETVEWLPFRFGGYYELDSAEPQKVCVWWQTKRQRDANSGFRSPVKSGATRSYTDGRTVKEEAHLITPENGGKCIDGTMSYFNINMRGLCFGELTSTNITFVARRPNGSKVIYAPMCYGNFLPGTKQSHLLAMAKERGYEIIVDDIPMTVEAIDKLHIIGGISTGSAGGITPIDCFVDRDGKTIFEFKSTEDCKEFTAQYYEDILDRNVRPNFSVMHHSVLEN